MKHSVSHLATYLAGTLSVVAFAVTVMDAPFWSAMLAWLAAYGAVAATPESRRRHLTLVATMLLVLGISPLGTSTEINPGAIMTLGMLVAVGLPFLVQKLSKVDADLLHLRLRWGWPTKREWGISCLPRVLHHR